MSLPNIDDELEIVWLVPFEYVKEHYDYLREDHKLCNFRVKFPLKGMDPEKTTDGGSGAHIVAYATLAKVAMSNDGLGRRTGFFERRYWWVKGYDRYRGYRGNSYPEGGPAEAVLVNSIQPRVESVRGWLERKHLPYDSVQVLSKLTA